MKRAATFLIPAFLLLAFAAFLGFTNGFVLERGSPTGLLKNYAEAGSEGDLVALGELGDPRKIERESAILGQAYSDQVEHALFRGMVAGGHLAYAATKRLQEETLPQAVNAYWVEQPEGVEDRQLWILTRALSRLTTSERQFVRLNEENEVESVWDEIVAAGNGDWNRLSWRVRQKVDPELFFCEYGAPKTSADTQLLLLLAGASKLEAADQVHANEETLIAWRDTAVFRQAHGERILSELYAEGYGKGDLDDIEVSTAPVEGMLFRPGRADVSAERAGGSVRAGMVHREEGWVMTSVSDVDVPGKAEELCSMVEPVVEEPTKEAAPLEVPADPIERPDDIEPVEIPEVPPPSPFAGECAWNDIDQTPLAFSRVDVNGSGSPAVQGLWSYAILGLVTVTFVVVMLVAARGRNLDAAKIDLQANETALDSLETKGRFVRGRITLTTKRLIIQRVHWWLASTATTMLSLGRLETASLKFGMNWLWILLGLALLPIFAPAGVLIAMYALVAARVRLRFAVGGRGHSFGLSGTDMAVRDGFRFVRGSFRQQLLLSDGTPGDTDLMDPDPVPNVRSLPSQAWIVVLGCMAVAALQRVIFGGVDLEASLWMGPYMLLPAAIGRTSGARAGGLVGIFGGLGIFAVMQPSPMSGMGSVGTSAGAMVLVFTVLAFFASGVLVGKFRHGVLAIFAALAALIPWWLLPFLADAPVAGTTDWLAHLLVGGSILFAGLGFLVMSEPGEDRDDETPGSGETAPEDDEPSDEADNIDLDDAEEIDLDPAEEDGVGEEEDDIDLELDLEDLAEESEEVPKPEDGTE